MDELLVKAKQRVREQGGSEVVVTVGEIAGRKVYVGSMPMPIRVEDVIAAGLNMPLDFYLHHIEQDGDTFYGAWAEGADPLPKSGVPVWRRQ